MNGDRFLRLVQEPESPLRAPYSFATYDVPEDLHLPILEGRDHVVVRLVSTHPLWAHHLSVLLSSKGIILIYLIKGVTLWDHD